MLKLNLTRLIASYLREKLNLNPEEEAIALYGLQNLIYSITNLFLICFIGWVFGCFRTTLVATLSAGLLRLFSGGAHAKSPVTCALVGMIVALCLGKAALIIAPLFSSTSLLMAILTCAVVSLIFILVLAPVDSPAKPVTSLVYKQRMRFLSVLTVILVTALQILLILWNKNMADIVLSISMGNLWQIFTLTKLGHAFATILDYYVGKEGVK